MKPFYSVSQLEAYLDEGLAAPLMADIENALREDEDLCAKLQQINRRRDAGIHTLGEIWRRHRIGVPSREQLGSYLLGILDDEEAEYIRFRIEILGCRVTEANLEDLRQQQASQGTAEHQQRRQRYFQSSAGYLKRP